MKPIVLLHLIAFFAWLSPQAAWAAKPSEVNASVQNVKQVLTLEASTDSAKFDRRERLHPTAHPKTASSVEWWQAGFVKIDDAWRDAAKQPASGSSAVLDRYRTERAAAHLTASGQFKLADWCREAKLLDQERAHLSQVLMHNDRSIDRMAIYKRMGYRRIGDQWVSAAEAQQLQLQAQRRQAELVAWQPVVERLVRNWGTNARQQKLAKDELAGIHHKSAIPSLLVAVGSGESIALAICEHLKQLDCFESSQALATISVQAPWPSVRKRASESLKERRIDDFAPALLGEMHSPFVSTTNTLGANTPKLILREDADRYFAVDVSVLDVTYQVTTYLRQQKTTIERTGRARGEETVLARQDKSRIIDDIEFEIQARIDAENDRAEEYNERAATVLAEVTGQERSSDPRYWWAWWHLHTGTEQLPKRFQVTSRQVEVPTFLHRTLPSCLVAGTPICTDQGFVGIDQINVGDLVLAKDVSTGEIAFKPVLQTTVRRPVPVKTFVVADTKITASDGHHFWVSGSGWNKTRELTKDQPVHTATGMARIVSIEAEPDVAPVYNLVVADFHTYFVGSEMVLSHDVLLPSPTNVKVPGLEVEVASKPF